MITCEICGKIFNHKVHAYEKRCGNSIYIKNVMRSEDNTKYAATYKCECGMSSYFTYVKDCSELDHKNVVELELYDDYENDNELCSYIGLMENLEVLNCYHGGLVSVSGKIFENLKKLKYLSFDLNKLTVLPPEIGNLESLEELVLSENDLTELPKEIAKLKNLKKLTCWGNDLKDIPDEIYDMEDLEIND